MEGVSGSGLSTICLDGWVTATRAAHSCSFFSLPRQAHAQLPLPVHRNWVIVGLLREPEQATLPHMSEHNQIGI